MRHYLRNTGLSIAALGLAVGVALPQDAQAAFKLRLTQGASSITITDGGVGDTSAIAGVILFNGSLGVFNVNVTTSLSKPVIGTSNQARMDLNSVNVASASGGTLTIQVTDTDFALPVGSLQSSALIGGTTNGSVSYQTWFDNGNAEFGMATALTSVGPLGPGAFADTSFGPVVGAAAPYSLTQEVTIAHTGPGQVTSFDAEIRVPEPASLALFGLGLLGLGFVARRRRRAA